uniref:Restin homolog n=1 Tax=Cacopsylla melanoneura TaxID=428564 RepID=A0A8D8UKG3_9HEMI
MPSSVSFYSTSSGSNRYSWSSQSNNDGLNSSMRKISDDSMSHSRLFVASSDQSSLWGDVRKLSEAGISRRTSSVDSSQILTEDTDSFIIGDRVYVGGTKSGRIAYIGETKFAPGDWAGIVLDDPVGKNDGTVGQCRYFQCDAKHGIFSRLTRLTRTPLDMPPPPATPTPSSYRGMEAGGGFVSPTGSARSLSFSTPGPGSTPAGKGSDIRLGDRVIVMSAQGSKTGVLRFKGTTQFAQGEWCGVELDEPVGKNDGTVEGVRYFQCEPRFGLFSPVHKVSKSPMSGTKRLSCAVHHGLRRSGSRESITSNFSNITATSVKSNLRRPSSIIKSPTSATPSTTSKNSMQEFIPFYDYGANSQGYLNDLPMKVTPVFYYPVYYPHWGDTTEFFF